MKLWVDDVREAPEGWTLATDYETAKRFLSSVKIEVLSLDHDLGEDSLTGYDIAKQLVEHSVYPNDIYCHSMNPVGRHNIIALLKHYAPEGVTVHP